MASVNPIRAVYENGFLRPLQPLSLRDHQQVKIIVLPEVSYAPADPERVRQLHEQADVWLAQQRPDAVREPRPLSSAEKARLDAEFDQLLAEIRAKSAESSEEELASRVEAAIAAVRAGDA